MAVVNLRKSEVKKIIGNKKDEEIDHTLSMLSATVERIINDDVEVEIAPNRPDMLSEQGVLRALRSFTGKKKGLAEIEINKSGYQLIVEKSLPKNYPYGIACIVKGLKLDDDKIKEIIDIQEKIGTILLRKRKKGGIGFYPLNKISFPVRLRGLNPTEIKFRPLEFPKEINAKQILSQHPTGREYSHLLKEWDKYPVFIDAKNTIISMPPVINSQDVGKIDVNASDVFIEVTGVDYNLLKKIINIIIFALFDMGGKVYSIDCIQSNGKKETIPNVSPEKIKLSIENTNKLIGLNLKEKEIKELLERMGYSYNSNSEVLIPCYRADILHEVDLIEDIAIAYGYDKLIPEIPEISTIGEIDKKEIIKTKISEILIGLEFLETSSYHFVTKESVKKTNIPLREYTEVKSAKTDYTLLRNDLSLPLFKILSENIDVEYPH